MARSLHYQIRVRVQGELAPAWSTVFADLAVVAEPDGSSLISGELADEAALHGVLATVRDLGLSVMSVETAASPRPALRPEEEHK